MMKILKRGKLLVFCALLCLLFATVASAAGSGDVASAVESTWTTASTQRGISEISEDACGTIRPFVC